MYCVSNHRKTHHHHHHHHHQFHHKHQQQYPSHRFEITKPMQLSWTKLVQHAKSKLHQKASICNAGEDNLQNLPGLAGSPSHSEFAELIQEAKSPSTFQASCGRDKRRAMLWTLAEAAMDIDRTCLQNAVSICLTQDASAGRLLVNVSASCTKLERRNHEKTMGTLHLCIYNTCAASTVSIVSSCFGIQ